MAGGPAVRLYRAELSTNCERVGLALAHKGIEAQSILIEYSNRRPVEQISGQALVPVIEDAGEVISDSVAIMRHLDRRTPERPLFPDDPTPRAGVDVFVGWFENVYKAAPNAIEAELEREDPDEALVERLGAEMAERLEVFEGLLNGGDYLVAGQLTRRRLRRLPVPEICARPRSRRHGAVPFDPRRPPAARRLASAAARVDRAHRRAAVRILSTMSDELDELRARVAELERRVAVLFQQTGAADWEADARSAPPVSDEVRLLLGQGETRKAAKLYMQETGAGIGEATAALGELAKELRGE